MKIQLFIYRRLGRSRRPKDPTDTIRHIVEVICFVRWPPYPSHFLGSSSAEHELKPRWSRANWAARTHRPYHLSPAPGLYQEVYSRQLNCLLR
jgi:hypothetical protein